MKKPFSGFENMPLMHHMFSPHIQIYHFMQKLYRYKLYGILHMSLPDEVSACSPVSDNSSDTDRMLGKPVLKAGITSEFYYSHDITLLQKKQITENPSMETLSKIMDMMTNVIVWKIMKQITEHPETELAKRITEHLAEYGIDRTTFLESNEMIQQFHDAMRYFDMEYDADSLLVTTQNDCFQSVGDFQNSALVDAVLDGLFGKEQKQTDYYIELLDFSRYPVWFETSEDLHFFRNYVLAGNGLVHNKNDTFTVTNYLYDTVI